MVIIQNLFLFCCAMTALLMLLLIISVADVIGGPLVAWAEKWVSDKEGSDDGLE